jgi:cell division protein FtsQ
MKKFNWKNIVIIIVILGLLSYVVFAVLKFSHKNEDQKCESVVITIKDSAKTQFVSSKDIKDRLIKEDIKLVGKRFKKINTEKIEKTLEENPFILNVECYTTSSGDLNIDVWQREPVFRVYGKSSYYVDVQGKTFPISSDYVAYVPVVSCPAELYKSYVTGPLKGFMIFIKNDPFWSAQIEQVDVQLNGDVILIPRVGDQEIEIGRLEDYPSKLAKLKEFYKKGLNKIGWGDYKRISIKFKNQVVCTRK